MKRAKKKKYFRNWRVFNKREFEEELGNIRLNDLIKPEMNTNTSMSLVYNKVLKLLDEMAPYKKLTQKEIQLQQKPWITSDILLIMQKRDALYKDFAKEKNSEFKK